MEVVMKISFETTTSYDELVAQIDQGYLVDDDFYGVEASCHYSKNNDGLRTITIITYFRGFTYEITENHPRFGKGCGVKYTGAFDGFLKQNLLPIFENVRVMDAYGSLGTLESLGSYRDKGLTLAEFVAAWTPVRQATAELDRLLAPFGGMKNFNRVARTGHQIVDEFGPLVPGWHPETKEHEKYSITTFFPD